MPTFEQVVQVCALLTSSGALVGGLGILKWGLSCERRLMKLEVRMGIGHD